MTTQDSLNQIVTKISAQTDRLAAGVRTTVEAAREIGLHLIEAKKLLKETGAAFKVWVGEHCRFSYITACRYVRLVENWERFTDDQKSTHSIPQLLDQVAGHRRPARQDDAQPETEKHEAVAAVRPASPTCLNLMVPPAHHASVATNIREDAKPYLSGSREDARPITVTHAQVRQAAEKYKLDHLLAAVPTDRWAGFLAELGVTVEAEPVLAAA